MGMFANEKEKWIECQKQEMREKSNMTHYSIVHREKLLTHKESFFSFLSIDNLFLPWFSFISSVY